GMEAKALGKTFWGIGVPAAWPSFGGTFTEPELCTKCLQAGSLNWFFRLGRVSARKRWTSEMAYCTKCGANVPETAAFCQVCGQPQATTGTGTAASAPVAQPQSGLSENVAAMLSYVLGWLTGIIFYLIDRRPYVRFHAAQSIVTF